MKNIFEIKEDFYLNNNPIKIISGAIHYFRIIPEYWRDRLEKLKAMGCNTVETYVPWNLHEPKSGEFQFKGMLNIESFIKIAEELELFVILRPSPYICAEWEFGGLPAWILAEDGMKVRSSYEPFLTKVDKYYDKLFQIVTPLQINYGGPIIMMQIENEYGYYGNDKKYLGRLKDIMIKYGTVVPLVTSDGPWGEALNSGMLLEENILPTANFGSSPEEHFPKLKAIIGNKPLMCMEFWIGWFDDWGSKHHVRDFSEVSEDLDKILEQGHVNIYMFHGGTNFGFMNGSNYQEKLTADTTSYDYDALLTEGGDITPKYEAFKKIISKYKDIPEVKLSTEINKIAYGKISLVDSVSLFNTLDKISTPVYSQFTLPMEKLGQNYGYILYRAKVKTSCKQQKFKILGGSDRANVYINEKHMLTQYDKELGVLSDIVFDIKDNKLDILMENMGRVNFGEKLNYQRKGIVDGVLLDTHAHAGFNHYCLPLDNIEQVDFKADFKQNTPAFYKFEFEASILGDTFLRFDGWGKGCAFVNGFNIGRFWEIGPQKSLYIPAPLLKIGKNVIIIFETEGKWSKYLTLEDAPDLGN